MGFVGKLLSFARDRLDEIQLGQAKLDQGGGEILTADHFEAAGMESHPLPQDYMLAIEVPGSGQVVSLGYLDPKLKHTTEKGEVRLYSRSKSDGKALAEIHLMNDGEIQGKNENGYFRLESDGDYLVNGARITKDGEVINKSGIVLGTHIHPQGADSGGHGQANTGAPQ